MKRILLASLFLLVVFLLPSSELAQEEARAAWQVTNFDITANAQQVERSLNSVAVLSARNVGRGAGSTFTFRISSKASIKSVAVGGASATYRTVPETRGNLQRVTVTLGSSVAPGGLLNLSVTYAIAVESNSGLAAISVAGS